MSDNTSDYRPPIVCLCGSSRFGLTQTEEQMLETTAELWKD